MNTLDLEAAAALLGIHPTTLQARAKCGVIPGAKVGKEWRFLDVDLVEYLRSQYPANRRESCQSTNAAVRGGSIFRTKAKELDSLLTPKSAKKRNDSTTKSKPNSGTERTGSITYLMP